MNSTIDFGNPETWPEMLRSLVFDFSEKISHEKKAGFDNILAGKANYHVIEKPTYDRVKSEIEELLSDSSVLAWHCTKLIDPEKIKAEGLRPFSVEILKGIIKNDLGNYLNTKDQKIINKKIDKFEEAGHFRNRKNQIWFLFNQEMWSDSECQEFFDFFGGEALQRVIENELPEYIPTFQQVGDPYLIEFPVELSQISSDKLSYLADQLIDFGIKSRIHGNSPKLFADGYICTAIPPTSLISIIPIPRTH